MDRLRAPAIIQCQCSHCADGCRGTGFTGPGYCVADRPPVARRYVIWRCAGRTGACAVTERPGSGASPQAEREHGQRAQQYQPGHQAPQPAEHRRDHHQDRQQDDGQDWRLSTDLCSRNMRPHAHRIARLFDIRYPASVFRPVNHASPVVAVAVVASDPARRPLRPPLIRRGCPSHVTRTT